MNFVGITPTRPLVLIGAGKMGGAMLDGWLANGLDPAAILVVDPGLDTDIRTRLQAVGVSVVEPDDTLPTPSVLLLAVKPQMMVSVLPAFAGLGARSEASSMLVISVAAGTTIATLEQAFGAAPSLLRAMPNTPALVGQGAIGIYASKPLPPVQSTLVSGLMDAIGKSVFVARETDIDAVTALSGSGPAYVFHLVEALAEAGEAEGLDAPTAMALARQTIVGAGALLSASPETASQLRINVTSPKGTTEAGLAVLIAQDGLRPLIRATVAAARNRAIALGKT